jgi:hypothetical protein
MDKMYWTGRNRDAMAMARDATTAESRLIHYELAGRYSIKAAQCLPFMLPSKGPATPGERDALRISKPDRSASETRQTLSLPSPRGRGEDQRR